MAHPGLPLESPLQNGHISRTIRQFEHDESLIFRIGFDVLFSELYKTMVNKVTSLDFRVGDRHPHPPESAPV